MFKTFLFSNWSSFASGILLWKSLTLLNETIDCWLTRRTVLFGQEFLDFLFSVTPSFLVHKVSLFAY